MLASVRRLAVFALGLIAVGACRSAYAGPLKTWGAEPPSSPAESEPPPETTPPPPPPSRIGTPMGEPAPRPRRRRRRDRRSDREGSVTSSRASRSVGTRRRSPASSFASSRSSAAPSSTSTTRSCSSRASGSSARASSATCSSRSVAARSAATSCSSSTWSSATRSSSTTCGSASPPTRSRTARASAHCLTAASTSPSRTSRAPASRSAARSPRRRQLALRTRFADPELPPLGVDRGGAAPLQQREGLLRQPRRPRRRPDAEGRAGLRRRLLPALRREVGAGHELGTSRRGSSSTTVSRSSTRPAAGGEPRARPRHRADRFRPPARLERPLDRERDDRPRHAGRAVLADERRHVLARWRTRR